MTRGDATRRLRRAALGAGAAAAVTGGLLVFTGGGSGAVVPSAVLSGHLYFTVFAPASVDVAGFRYQSGRLQLSLAHRVIRLRRADGLAFAPDGRLFVGGSRSGDLFEVDPSSGRVRVRRAGVPAAMHLTLAPNGRLYASGEPGPLAVFDSSDPRGGRAVALSGADPRVTALAFGPHGQTLYTSSAYGGRGDIGFVDLRTGVTRRLFTDVVGAHGVVYDRWSRSYLLVGGDVLLQISASHPSRVESELAVPGNQFDQAAVTGRGQILVASNFGSIVLVDYSRTGLIGNVANRVVSVHVADHLDDVAPLVGPGAAPTSAVSGTRLPVGGSLIGTGALLAGGLARRARRSARRRGLPRWDRRARARSATRATSR